MLYAKNNFENVGNFGVFFECSHKVGMGHFFRMMNFVEFLEKQGAVCHVFVNDDAQLSIEGAGFARPLYRQNFKDISSDWESATINKYKLDFWVNDRLTTTKQHSQNVKKNNVKLISFDDEGEGADFADFNICALPCRSRTEKGRTVLKGVQYLILNPEIDKYKRKRTEINKIIVTLGGSDTYGVVLKVAEILKNSPKFNQKEITIVTGPLFDHKKELEDLNKFAQGFFVVKNSVKNLIEEFQNYDLAITSGGMTAFEAAASGLPSITVANELHEISNAAFLEVLGTSFFAGYHSNINNFIFEKGIDIIKKNIFNILKMSQSGMNNVSTKGCENIFKSLLNSSELMSL